MKNLGKIILFLLLLQYTLQADIRATVDSSNVELGEMVVYSLHLPNEDVQVPNITTICGVDVTSSASKTSITMVNGHTSKTYVLNYRFTPQESCTIESIDVNVKGKIEKTNPIKINVDTAAANKDANFILTLESTKKEVYIGEPFEVTLNFKQKQGFKAIDNEFKAPNLNGFWIKEKSNLQKKVEGDYIVTRIKYKVAAQRAGELTITKAQIKIATRSNERNNWGLWENNIKWKTYFSNELNVDVKELPDNLSLVGNFSIKATTDKLTVAANEAVNLNIEVLGNGNLEDIKSFKPIIDGVSVFDEKAKLEEGKLTQKIAFVGERDFVIPSFTLKYFDPISKEVKTTSTKEISIKVTNAKPQEEVTVKRDGNAPKETIVNVKEGFSKIWLVLVFILGITLGILIVYLKPLFVFKKRNGISIKDPKKLLIKLLPYKSDKMVEEFIDSLEKKIYLDANIELDKKLLKEIIKKYNLV